MSEAAVILLWFLFLVLWLAISAIVASHAEENDVPGGVLWGVLVFFMGLIGIGFYVLAFIFVDRGGDNGSSY